MKYHLWKSAFGNIYILDENRKVISLVNIANSHVTMACIGDTIKDSVIQITPPLFTANSYTEVYEQAVLESL